MTVDVERELRAALSAEADRFAASDAFEARVDRRAASLRRRSRIATAALAGLGLVAVVAAVAVVGHDNDPHVTTTPTATTAPPLVPTPDTWRAIAPSPLSPRHGVTSVWTGSEMLVLGGDTNRFCPPGADCAAGPDPSLADGAAYNPATDSWRAIAAAPTPFAYASAVWTGDLVVVASSEGILTYDPASDTWTPRVRPPEVPLGQLLAVDRLVLFFADENELTPDWLYDPEADSWTPLPSDPLGRTFDRGYAWTGHELLLFALPWSPSPGSEGPVLYEAAAYDLREGNWRRLADSAVAFGSSAWYVLDGKAIDPYPGFVDGGEVNPYDRPYPTGGIYDIETDTWEPLPQPATSPAADAVSLSGAGVVAGWIPEGQLLFSPGRGWHAVPSSGLPVADGAVVSTGDELIAWVGEVPTADYSGNTYVNEGRIYTPPAQ